MLAGMTFPTGEALWTSAGTSRYLSSFCSKLPRLSSRSRYSRGQPNYGFSLPNPQQDADHCLKEDAGGPHPERGGPKVTRRDSACALGAVSSHCLGVAGQGAVLGTPSQRQQASLLSHCQEYPGGLGPSRI
ncbi:uncharacterized protein LOC121836831 isoform X1 [Ixodes scapularis]|uniref:uncharacterized protein LOC121836831 isoform X1 n=1 Tax=Ixodes scapularis TaxID=6945 RepID=UPI001C38C865|nr:uncharacterized protein LOC121836831 isoform X1 [Ixodes scapularis]